MATPITRRALLASAPAGLAAAAALSHFPRAARAADQPYGAPTALDSFPSQDPALARRVVGLSHRDLIELRKLIDPMPELAKAAIDWGFGDWESCIGAASHVGNREIATYLMAQGAAPNIFTFAMLGNLDAVRAIVAANPGVQRTRGPHGITLLRHAEAGADESAPVVEFLKSLGDADPAYETVELTENLEAAYAGVYSFGARDDERIEFKRVRMGFAVERAGRSPLRLFHLGDGAFHPTGAPSVRIRFTTEGPRATRVEFFNPTRYLVAERIG